MTTKREQYDSIVQVVEKDKELIVLPDYETMLSAPDGCVTLGINDEEMTPFESLTPFSDYAIRDALIIKAVSDEEFCFVLCNKITRTLFTRHGEEAIDQEAVEALALSAHIGMMWEQLEQAMEFAELVTLASERNSLSEPNLNRMTKMLYAQKDRWDFEAGRANMAEALDTKLSEALDE
jgi:hypothetical protein